MPAYTSPGGVVLGNAATENADTLALLKGMLDGSRGGTGLNTQTIPKFDSYAALNAAFPSPTQDTVPSLVDVRNVGHYQWIPAPYNLFAPLPGEKRRAGYGRRTDATPLISGPVTDYNITQTVTLPSFAWPTLVTVRFRVLIGAAVGTDKSNTFIKVNSATDGYFQLAGGGSAFTSITVVNEGTKAGAPVTTLIGAFERVTGTGDISVSSTDSRFTYLEYTVEPFYAGVGGP